MTEIVDATSNNFGVRTNILSKDNTKKPIIKEKILNTNPTEYFDKKSKIIAERSVEPYNSILIKYGVNKNKNNILFDLPAMTFLNKNQHEIVPITVVQENNYC